MKKIELKIKNQDVITIELRDRDIRDLKTADEVSPEVLEATTGILIEQNLGVIGSTDKTTVFYEFVFSVFEDEIPLMLQFLGKYLHKLEDLTFPLRQIENQEEIALLFSFPESYPGGKEEMLQCVPPFEMYFSIIKDTIEYLKINDVNIELRSIEKVVDSLSTSIGEAEKE